MKMLPNLQIKNFARKSDVGSLREIGVWRTVVKIGGKHRIEIMGFGKQVGIYSYVNHGDQPDYHSNYCTLNMNRSFVLAVVTS
jgi:hypothetical protein